METDDSVGHNAIMAIWNLMHANYAYFQRDKTPDELACLLDIWKQLLADVPGEALKASALNHISSSQWFPTVAELRNGAFDLLDRANGIMTSALEAWEEVRQNQRQYYPGITKAPILWVNPFAERALRAIGGFQMLFYASMDAIPSHRARFIEVYNTLEKRWKDDRRMLPQVRELVERLKMDRALDAGIRAEIPARAQSMAEK